MPSVTAPTIASLARDLAEGRTTSRQLVEDCLADRRPRGRRRPRVRVGRCEGARKAADAQDMLRKAGGRTLVAFRHPLCGQGPRRHRRPVTTAGSKALADREPATADSPVVARIRAAGLVIVGRANMVEFAYAASAPTRTTAPPPLLGSRQPSRSRRLVVGPLLWLSPMAWLTPRSAPLRADHAAYRRPIAASRA